MDDWIQTREAVWKRKEEQVFLINSERMRRFVSRRKQLRELMLEWEQERAQALLEASADAAESLDSVDAKVFGWKRAKHQAQTDAKFERLWREREGKIDADARDDEHAEYQFYLSAWHKNWAHAWMSSGMFGHVLYDAREYATERVRAQAKERERLQEMEEERAREYDEELQLWRRTVEPAELPIRMRELILKQGMELGKEMEMDEDRRDARKKVREMGRKLLREKESAGTRMQFINKTREHFSELGTSDEWSEKIGWWEEHFRRQLWDGGRLVRLHEEREWIHRDQRDHADDWGPSARRLLHFWWDEVNEWEERMAWRMLVIEEFEDTSMSLLRELGKIDGSAAAREFNAFNTSSFAYEEDRRHQVADYVAGMKVAMGRGNEARFIRGCDSALGIIGATMRSGEIKQGDCASSVLKFLSSFY